MTTDATTKPEVHKFEADVNELLKLVIHSLYSHKEVFLRELVSNAFDALEKRRFQSLSDTELAKQTTPLEVRLIPNKENGTLTIEDTGIGMSHDELVKNLGTIAHSGSKAFLEKLKGGDRKDMTLIGQFGVGFYSAYLVADKVTVISRAAGSNDAYAWTSDANDSFTVEKAEKPEIGTSIVLHLKSDQKSFLDDWELRNLVTRYSDYVSHPIKLRKVTTTGKAGSEDEKTEITWETVNKATALWQRSPSDVTSEQYEEFYKHLTHDFENPLGYSHFKIEGTQLYSGILFIPRRAPYDLYQNSEKKGIRLYVKRVFIMEECDTLLPAWLRFVRGVIDSDDLPLNVSRELLQDSSIVRSIKKQIVKKSLEKLEQIATDSPEDYKAFWSAFGPVLKEGIALDMDNKDRVAALARYRTTHDSGELGDTFTSLADYVKRMKEGQPAIYYAVGDSPEAVQDSPYLEALKGKGYEVLLMSDPVDEWVMEALPTFEEKPFVSAMRADLKMDKTDEEKKKTEEASSQYKSVCERMKAILEDRVLEVRVSDRLTDSPCCLVVPEGGYHAPVERLLRAAGREVPAKKRILEVNPTHPIMESIKLLSEKSPSSPKIAEWVETLYDQAVLMEGGKVEDPNRFAKRINSLLREVSSQFLHSA